MTKTLKYKSSSNNRTHKVKLKGGINIFGKSDYNKSIIKPKIFQEPGSLKMSDLPFMYFYDIQFTTEKKEEKTTTTSTNTTPTTTTNVVNSDKKEESSLIDNEYVMYKAKIENILKNNEDNFGEQQTQLENLKSDINNDKTINDEERQKLIGEIDFHFNQQQT
jgi:hypothetical protein